MTANSNDTSEARPADPGEEERMPTTVYWMYARGQRVALWKSSGLISLVPDSLPAGQVILLQKGDSPGAMKG